MLHFKKVNKQENFDINTEELKKNQKKDIENNCSCSEPYLEEDIDYFMSKKLQDLWLSDEYKSLWEFPIPYKLDDEMYSWNDFENMWVTKK